VRGDSESHEKTLCSPLPGEASGAPTDRLTFWSINNARFDLGGFPGVLSSDFVATKSKPRMCGRGWKPRFPPARFMVRGFACVLSPGHTCEKREEFTCLRLCHARLATVFFGRAAGANR
jgi:hypothetical protein